MRRAGWLLLVIGTALAFAPLISVLVASGIATHYGCQLDEGSVHPCLVGGQDIGDTLYTLGVLGWLMLVTVPFMAILPLVWVWLLGRALLKRRRRPASPS